MPNDQFLALKSLDGPILITGHTGFKGTWMTLLLESLGFEVVGLSLPAKDASLFSSLGRKGKINEIIGDIRSFDSTNAAVKKLNPAVIIHMAAQALVLESYKDPRLTFETNVLGTVNILEAARASVVQIVQVITTDKVYENLGTGKRFQEHESLSGKDPYSASKVGTESVVAAWKQIKEVTGGPLVHSVRAGNVIGGGDFAQDRLIPDVMRAINDHETFYVRSPESTRPWQHVLDPLIGYLLSLEFNLKGNLQENFNFGPNEESLTVQRVLEHIEGLLPEFKWRKQNNQDLRKESILLDLDSHKAKKLLGWNPNLNQLEAVSSTIAWWKKVNQSEILPSQACNEDLNKFLRSIR